MKKYQPGTSGVLVFGTDGEENLTKALKGELDVAKHLRCDIHLRDNIKSKMKELALDEQASSEILADIFGKNGGNTREGGLIDLTSTKDYDTACANVTKKWAELYAKGNDFAEYFLKDKAGVLRESCRADIRSMCGLGFPPSVYTQNANESMNRLIKNVKTSKYGNQSTSLLNYIDVIEKEVVRQHNEQFLAMLGRGEYRLIDEFKFLEVKENDFYRMTKCQKDELRKKFFECTMSKQSQKVDKNFYLSVPVEESQLINIPFTILKGMFQKASDTVKEKKGIWKVPEQSSSEINYFVKSKSTPAAPHKIRFRNARSIRCDGSCISFPNVFPYFGSLRSGRMSEGLSFDLCQVSKASKPNWSRLF